MVAVGDKTNRKFQHIVKALLDWGTAKGHALKTADVWRNVCQEAVLCGCRVSLRLANRSTDRFCSGLPFQGLFVQTAALELREGASLWSKGQVCVRSGVTTTLLLSAGKVGQARHRPQKAWALSEVWGPVP